jgi:hypothetical protein
MSDSAPDLRMLNVVVGDMSASLDFYRRLGIVVPGGEDNGRRPRAGENAGWPQPRAGHGGVGPALARGLARRSGERQRRHRVLAAPGDVPRLLDRRKRGAKSGALARQPGTGPCGWKDWKRTLCGQAGWGCQNSDPVIIEPLTDRPPEGLSWCPERIGHLAEVLGLLDEIAASLAAYDPSLTARATR